MKQTPFRLLLTYLFVCLAVGICATANAADPLPSWNESSSKQAILEFVAAVTDQNSTDYVKPAHRIAVFDNDGTLWVEYPMYTQLLFAFERVKELAPNNSKWKTEQPFQAVLENDLKTVGASGMEGVMQILMATHSGMTVDEFDQEVSRWLATTKHPRFNRLYSDCIYQPQLELLSFLRANKFKTFIVSGGGIQFMRTFTQKAYGIPPSQVVGSSIRTVYEMRDGQPVLVRQPEIDFINDKAGKPVGIYKHIGRRPILAFGNSDSDMQMIEYITSGKGRRLGLFVHHTDADREYAYDRKSHIGTLNKTLDLADEKGWFIVNMKKDWKTVFSLE